jgi:transposase InsO family protein
VVNHKRVAWAMRDGGLAGLRLRRRHRTTIGDPAASKAPDLIGRDFTADAPNAPEAGWPARSSIATTGLQCTSRAFAETCQRAGVVQSMGTGR